MSDATPLQIARSRLENAKVELAYAQRQVLAYEQRVVELTPPFEVGDTVRFISAAFMPVMPVLAINMSFGEWVVKVHWPYNEQPTYHPADQLMKKADY